MSPATRRRRSVRAAPAAAPTIALELELARQGIRLHVGIPPVTAPLALTVTGNEITDATRKVGAQGDGRVTKVTNLCTNSGFETNTNGWTANVGTIARDPTVKQAGAASLKMSPSGGLGGASYAIALAAGTTYTFSCWALIPVGASMRFSSPSVGGPNIVGTGAWQRVSWTYTPAAAEGVIYLQSTGVLVPYWIDGFQIETGAIANGYVPTDGAAATAYFGLDSSFGVWKPATNLMTNGGFETAVAPWGPGAGATIARAVGPSKFGAACGLFSATAATDGLTVNQPAIPVVAGTAYTFSFWVLRAAGARNIRAQLNWLNAASGVISAVFSPPGFLGSTTTWQRVTFTATAPAGAVNVYAYVRLEGGVVAAGDAYYLDGAQFEAAAIATPYVHTDGATATRNAARVQLPTAGAGFDLAHGWAAFRLRPGWTVAQPPVDPPVAFFVPPGSGPAYVRLMLAGANWNLGRTDGTNAWSTNKPVVDGPTTLVAAWTPTTLSLSVNGSPFATVTFAAQAFTAIAALADLLGYNGAGNFYNGDGLWFACGAGPLVDADAAALHGFGDAGPSSVGQLPGSPHVLWPADDANAQQTTGDYADTLTLWRVATESGSKAYLRGWVDHDVTDQATVLAFDWEVPLGVEVVYYAQASTGGVDSAIGQSAPIELDDSHDWLIDIARPTNSIPIGIESLPELAFDGPVGVHRVLDRRDPILTTGALWTPSGELTFVTATLLERDRVRAILGAGLPFLLRTPPEEGVGNIYLGVTQLREQRASRLALHADRRFVVDVVQVARPDPSMFVPLPSLTYADRLEQWPTYAAVAATGFSYEELAYSSFPAGSVDPGPPWLPDDV